MLFLFLIIVSIQIGLVGMQISFFEKLTLIKKFIGILHVLLMIYGLAEFINLQHQLSVSAHHFVKTFS